MDYTPTNTVLPPKTLPNTPIYIGPFEDHRKTPDQIGQNSEKAKIIPAKVEPGEVIPFMEKAFKQEFKRVGLNPVDSKGQAKRILQLTINSFWVEEKDIYESSLVAQISVFDPSGKKLYSDNFRGVSKRWGSSYDSENYRKVLSDTVVDLLKKVLDNDAFMKSLA